MQLTGKQIVETNIITNYTEAAVQQQGVDVRIDSLSKVGGYGYIPVEGKTELGNRTEERISIRNGKEVFILTPGYYEVTLKEACKIPNNCVLNYKTRSSLVRCGVTVFSGQFDAGFETEAMGCFMEVRHPVRIEPGARIAQAIVCETYPVSEENLYNGQWQNDKQRKNKKGDKEDQK